MNKIDLERNSAAAPPPIAGEEVICLFAFAQYDGALERRPPEAVLERRLILHRVGSVAALIGVVPVADYCGADAERRLADVAWLAPRVRRHAALVDWAAQWSSVFPAPFGTLYESLDSLTAFTHAHVATIAEFLQAVAGKEEWELRGSARLDEAESLDRLARAAWPDWCELTPGKRYMRLCRDRNALIEQGRAEAGAFICAFVMDLKPLTATVRLHEANRRPNGADEPELIARYSLLVAKPDVAALQERVRDASARASHGHVTIALSGPWPPFSFRPDLKAPH
ncbi:GvpL/GvpF family gas vesicle protein [Methylocella tundrae]|uniref:GvpL/GvpF family gas vesicle protein n=1 Tax=Methylocella tundrae TaxID=227605 RepID=UPI002ADEBC63|nr:GvpL/GvpF family gas vesicle protein [Methylocella tundrae]WPP03075.1 GvpL/GvpF family gas vesicle protein [Methylocella tundrae]